LVAVLELEVLDSELGVFAVRLDRNAQPFVGLEEDFLIGNGGLIELARDLRDIAPKA
jgi:hypothetical protein